MGVVQRRIEVPYGGAEVKRILRSIDLQLVGPRPQKI